MTVDDNDDKFLIELQRKVEVDEEKLTVSADSRFSANSNDIRVRVDGSKKRFTTVTPRKVGTFGIGLSRISLNDNAESKMV